MINVGLFRVEELQTEPIFVSASTPISKVIGILKDFDVYEVFVAINGKLGVVSVKDILPASNLTTKVSSIATYVPKISPGNLVSEAVKIMLQYKVKALPIVDREKIVGEISAFSIVKAIKNFGEGLEFKVNKIMTGNPKTINKDDSAAKARSLMVKNKISHLPVLFKKKLQGVLTSRHIVCKMFPSEALEMGARGLEELRRMNFPVRELMDVDVPKCDPNEKVLKAVERMVEQKKTYVIATLWEEVQGILTTYDILKLVSPAEKPEIPVYIVGLPEDPFEAEVAKTKFIRAVRSLRKSLPYIEEANSIIKTSVSREDKERKRYEVTVTIRTPKRLYKFSESGWDLPAIYDVISDRIKRLMTKKSSPRNIRKMRTVKPKNFKTP